MSDQSSNEQREHEFTLQIFTISAGMVGVCLTTIGILRIVSSQTSITTIGDDLLAFDAVLFMLCCGLSFWSFKTKRVRRRQVLRLIIDGIFMAALAMMVAVCALITYAVV
jgi:hypothetical protein